MKSKEGSGIYDWIVPLMLGLIVLSISMYWIFHEYFDQDQIDWQTCRQSILLRSGNFGNGIKWLQENAPFKCKTQVVTIDFEDYDKAGELIMDTMAQCWYLFGEGKSQLYGPVAIGQSFYCLDCARITFSNDVRDYYTPSYKIPDGEFEKAESLAKTQSDAIKKEEEIQSVLIVGEEQWEKERQAELAKNKTDLMEMKAHFLKYKEESDNDLEAIANLDISLEEVNNKLSVIDKELAQWAIRNKLNRRITPEQFDALQFEYDAIIKKYVKTYIQDSDTYFDWRKYLTLEYGDTGQTYGQYIFRWDNPGLILTNQPFNTRKMNGFDFANNVVYDPYFDANKGDLIISVVSATGSVLFQNHRFMILVPHQTNQQLKCTIESIPA